MAGCLEFHRARCHVSWPVPSHFVALLDYLQHQAVMMFKPFFIACLHVPLAFHAAAQKHVATAAGAFHMYLVAKSFFMTAPPHAE